MRYRIQYRIRYRKVRYRIGYRFDIACDIIYDSALCDIFIYRMQYRHQQVAHCVIFGISA